MRYLISVYSAKGEAPYCLMNNLNYSRPMGRLLNIPRSFLVIKLFFLFWLFLSSVFAASHHPEEFLSSIRGSNEEGAQIYAHFCANCHAKNPLIPLGAPRIGSTQDWSPRLKQDISLLFRTTSEGYNAMPARGGCFECTDEQLILAVVELVPPAEKKSVLSRLRDYKKSTK